MKPALIALTLAFLICGCETNSPPKQKLPPVRYSLEWPPIGPAPAWPLEVPPSGVTP